MSLREAINRNQKLVAALGVVVVLALVGYIVYYSLFQFGNRPPGIGEAYYTTDNGATTFAAAANLNPPFDHDGQPAVRAYLFECGGKPFVGYLERYTPEAIKAFNDLTEALKTAKPGGGPPPEVGRAQAMERAGLQIKRPQDKEWISTSGPKAQELRSSIKCPDGGSERPTPVKP